jgi:Uma2 family endonuclease
MNIRPTFPQNQQMKIDEFLAFTSSRPQEERWELIEGVPVLNPSPIQIHQLVTVNIASFLMGQKEQSSATWIPLLGVGTRVPISPNSLPRPDVYVQEGPPLDRPMTDDALVIFEVLSKSNRKADREWRERVYTSIPNCQHYVTVSLKSTAVCAFARNSGWKEHRLKSLNDFLELPAIGVSMPLSAIYRWTTIGSSNG